MSKHWISFPGLGIDGFLMDPVAFNLFGRDIMWYGVIICTGMILALTYAYFRMIKSGIKEDDFYNLVIFLIPISVLCARLYYVIFDPQPNYHSLLDVIAIWRGGIGIYGGIIGGALTVIIFSKVRKISTPLMLDCAAPAVMIGQMIGRWGNFVNAEAHGGITSLPWRMGIQPYVEGFGSVESWTVCYHPTFLYESLWNLAGFLFVHFYLNKNKRFDGQVACFYLSWYGFGRGLIELLRTDSLEILGMKVSALVGFGCALVFGGIIIGKIIKIKSEE